MPTLLAALMLATSCGSATTLEYDGPKRPETGSEGEDSGNGNEGNENGEGEENSGGGESGGGGGGGETVHPSEISIAYLRSMATEQSVTIDKPYSVRGCVTATDAYGEYFKTICVEDSTGGIEVLIDGFSLYTLFALYDEVRIDCHGLALGRYGSRIELGMPPTGEYTVDRIPESETGRYFTIFDGKGGAFAPEDVAISDLQPSHVGRTVRIAGLKATVPDESWCDFDAAAGEYVDSERKVSDDAGAELTVCVRGECRYAAEPIPYGRFALCGVVEYRSGAYAIRPTNHGIFPDYDD